MKIDTRQYLISRFGDQMNHLSQVIIQGFTRNDMAVMFRELGFTRGVEIGTGEGNFAVVLCKANPNLELHTIDPYKLFENDVITDQNKYEEQYASACARLSSVNCTLVRSSSMQAVKDFPDGYFDFVYVDGNHHYEFVRDDLREWSKKVRSGGIVAGHDYMRYSTRAGRACCWGVKRAVNEYMLDNKIAPWYVFGQNPLLRNFGKCPKSFMGVRP